MASCAACSAAKQDQLCNPASACTWAAARARSASCRHRLYSSSSNGGRSLTHPLWLGEWTVDPIPSGLNMSRNGWGVFRRLREAASQAFEGEPVIFAYLFGSQATGKTHARSDVDVAVYVEDSVPP